MGMDTIVSLWPLKAIYLKRWFTNSDFLRDWFCMRRKELWLAAILFVGMTFCLGGCQNGKSAKSATTDPNAVFAQGGARAEAGVTPAHGGGRRGRGQSQSQNPGAGID